MIKLPEKETRTLFFSQGFSGQDDVFEFSFSGLKSAVINTIHNLQQRETVPVADVAAGFQAAVVDILVEKTCLAAKVKGTKNVLLAGGVAASSRLRVALEEALARRA